mmetsp:Transcript_30696/g.73740  ORF Transcript_30696/g.73740 Transcript_30696/m.73740 type:complete len:460 (-) Transcript_30696:65-1444(-)
MLISALSASISRAWSLTRLTSCSRSAFIFSLEGPTSATMRDCVEFSSFSRRCCADVSSATRSSFSVFCLVTEASSAAASSIWTCQALSSLEFLPSSFLSCCFSSSAVLFTDIFSSTSRSTSCPNLSIWTSRARASSSLSFSSLTFLLFSSWTCSRLSCLWLRLSSSFSSLSSSMRSRSRRSPWFVNTMVWLRSGGSFPLTRHFTWCILRVMTTCSSFRRCCLKVWNCWISCSVCLRARSTIFSFFTSASLSFLRPSTAFWNSAATSSWSSRFSRSSHTCSYRAGSQPGGQNSSSSSSSSSSRSDRSPSLSSEPSSLASSSSPSLSAFFFCRFIFFLKIFCSCSWNLFVSGTSVANSAWTWRGFSLSISAFLAASFSWQSEILATISAFSSRFWSRRPMRSLSRFSNSLSKRSSWNSTSILRSVIFRSASSLKRSRLRLRTASSKALTVFSTFSWSRSFS